MTMPDPKDGAEPAGAWAQSAKLAFRFLFLAVCLAALGWSVSNFRQVPPESRAIVYRFGSIVRQQGAGLLMSWPRPIEPDSGCVYVFGLEPGMTQAEFDCFVRIDSRRVLQTRKPLLFRERNQIAVN